MNFKKLFVVALAALSFSSCEEKESDIILFSKPNLNFSKDGGELALGLDCKTSWNVSIPEKSFIESVTPMSGNGNGTITVKVGANPDDTIRVTELNINAQSFLIMQQAIDIDKARIVGVWETATKNFVFTFNNDLTCKSVMTMGTYDGTYTISGNIITIIVKGKDGKDTTLTIIVKKVTETEMKAEMGGTTLDLTKSVI